MIEFACPKCKTKFRLPPETAGKVGTCKKCSSKFRVPAPKSPHQKRVAAKSRQEHTAGKTAKPAAKQTEANKAAEKKPAGQKKKVLSESESLMEEIRQDFEGKVPRNFLNLAYQSTLFVVALLMLLLPLLYTALIVGVGYGLYYYVTEVMPGLIDTIPRGRAAIIALIIYVSPLVIGSIMIIFMVKPLFFSLVPERANRQRSINRGGEPALFELVDRICEATRSPKPKRIDIDYQVNASASLRRGFRSLFTRDLVLTIGTPLIAGMNTRQLAGVLAHEFGHFSQGGGMKSTYVIRLINFWFARVVYQRDALDESLDTAIQEGDYRISIVLMLAKLFVYVCRGVLWLFMMIAHTVSCVMMRQMEYDADRYEAHVAGSEYFAVTSKRLDELAAGQQAVYSVVVHGLQNEALIRDIPSLTAHCADEVSSTDLKKLQAMNRLHTSRLLSTHPNDEDRIKAAKKLNAEGLFQIERPARELLRNFDAVCQGSTLDFYRNEVGIVLRADQLASSDE